MNIAFRNLTRLGSLSLMTALALGFAFAADSTRAITKTEAKELIAKASTPEEHHRLATYFTQKADMMEAEAVEHEDLAKEYAKNPGIHAMKHPMSGTTAAHCKYFAQVARKAAAEDRALAAAHESMANNAKH